MLNKRKSKDVMRNDEEEKDEQDNEPRKLLQINRNEGMRVAHQPPVSPTKDKVI